MFINAYKKLLVAKGIIVLVKKNMSEEKESDDGTIVGYELVDRQMITVLETNNRKRKRRIVSFTLTAKG